MRELFFRPPPEIRRRIDIAAIYRGERPTDCVRVHLAKFMENPIHALPAVEGEASGAWSRCRVALSDELHTRLRVFSAEANIPSLSTTINRILHAALPFEAEALAAVIAAPPQP